MSPAPRPFSLLIIKVNYLDLSVAILMAFINPQKYKKTILSVA